MNQLRLLVRALRWRLGAAVALLVVATVGILAAAAGPLYLETADDGVLQARLAAASPVANGLIVLPQPSQVEPGQQLSVAAQALREARRLGLPRWYGPAKTTLDAGFSVASRFGVDYGGALVYDPGQCGTLHFVAGSCPTRSDLVAVTQRSATALGAKVGSRLLLTLPGPVIFANGLPTQTSKVLPVVVAGIVTVGNPSAAFWFGADYFGFGGSCPPKAPKCLPQVDDFFTPGATVSHLAAVQAVDELPLRPGALHLGGVAAFQSAVAAFQRYNTTVLTTSVGTNVFNEIGTAQSENGLMQAIVLVVDLQLVLLSLFVLFGLVSRTMEAREKEVALAKLRGFRLQSVLAVGLLEPVAMLCMALPVGILLAFALLRAGQPLLLPGAVVAFSPLAPVAALAAFAGGMIAILFGARRILTRRLSDELRAVEPKTSSAARAALDAAALALALAGIVELLAAGVLSGAQPNPVAAFAPGLVAVAVAVVGVRALPLLAGVVVRRTRNTGRLALGLAVRQVVRRPASLRQITVLAVATGLAFFAVTGWAAAGVNRVERADFTLGAARVLTVVVPNGVNLEAAVDRADPSGRYAMAAMVSKIPSQNLLAVQVSRMQRVAYWPADVSPTSLGALVRWLSPHLQPPLILTGSALRATITMSGNPSPPPDLVINLVDSGGNPEVTDFGYLKPGTHTYTTTLPASCSGGCHALQLEPLWSPSQICSPFPGEVVNCGPQQVRYTLTISQLQTQAQGSEWASPSARLGDSSYWASSGSGMVVGSGVQGGAPALVLRVHDQASDTSSPSVSPGALPAVVPGVVTEANSVQDPAAASVEDFDGNAITLNVRYQAVALPQLGAEGFLIDLATAARAETSPPSQTVSEVWLSPHAPARVVRALTAQGLRITASQTPGPTISAMNHGGLALAYLFFLFAAGAAAILAIGAAVFSVFMTSRRRAFELAVLRAIGLPQRTLLRSLLGEQLLVLGPGVVLGIAAGLLGALMALPSVPEFTTTVGGPPVQLVFSVLPIGGMVVVLVVLLAVAALLASAATLRLASWDRLRTEIT